MHIVDGKAPEVILVTGGAGYIASHCSVLLLEAGYEVVIVDNLCNSSQEALIRVADIAGRPLRGFYQVDLLDSAALEAVFQSHPFSAVIHFAGIKAVGESVKEPLRYYHNNITGTLNLLQCMRKFRVRTLVYSSSATVYGEPSETPILETAEIRPTSPYGRTKAMIEQIIMDVTEVEGWQSVILRYFNPVGAHPSGRLGEAPQGVPNNLMPYLAQVAVGNLEKITILGSDYSTRDGTGMRDYIHVMDLCRGHLVALQAAPGDRGQARIYNLGTGVGYTVKEMISAFEAVTGKPILVEVGPRRHGDVAVLLADSSKANRELGWRADQSLEAMCEDLWKWQSTNPHGYSSK